MFRIVCLILAFNCFVIADEVLDRTVQLAVENRAVPFRPENFTTLDAALKDYSQSEGIKDAIAAFIKDQLGEEISVADIVNLNEIAMSGKSSDAVFFVYDASHHPIYVVKAFREPMAARSHFLRELSAMAFIQSSHWEELHTALPLSVGKCQDKETTYALLAETVAPGKRVADYIFDVRAQPKHSSRRKAALEKLKRAMAAAGRGFGALAKAPEQRRGPFPQEQIKKLASYLQKYLQSPAAYIYREQLPREQLQAYIENLLEEVAGMDHYYVFSHGDAHSRNCLYDADNDVFTLIDLGRMHESIDANGKPLGQVGYDYMRFIEDVQMTSFGQLDEQELKQALQAFVASYGSVAGSYPSAKNQEFYSAYRLLARLEKYADHVLVLDGRQQADRRRIFMYALERMAKRIAIPMEHWAL